MSRFVAGNFPGEVWVFSRLTIGGRAGTRRGDEGGTR